MIYTVKKIASMAGVSTRTINWYCKVGLLKPSYFQTGGHRLYSEKDLFRLQQIMALKFFDFSLSQIKTILSESDKVLEYFLMQVPFLEKRAQISLSIITILKRIISECHNYKNIPWKVIIELVEEHRLILGYRNISIGKIEILKEKNSYANLKSISKAKERNAFEQSWRSIIKQINSNLDQNPESKFGIDIAEQVTNLINSLYGNAEFSDNDNMEINKNNYPENTNNLSLEVSTWLNRSLDFYNKERIYSLLDFIGNTNASLLLQWNELIEEIFGDSRDSKQEMIRIAMDSTKVSTIAKKWLQKFSKQ
jgi:DNA-binding transcriptional MerR regulator